MLIIMEGTRPPTGASPTQPYKCGQYVKIKVNTIVVFDFNILTALKGRVGLAPQGPGALQTCRVWAGCPPNL